MTNITLDVGAAMNACLVKWLKNEEFKNVIIHLGDFHFLKENFKVLGLLIKNSGFQDIVFCSGICTSGSIELSSCRQSLQSCMESAQFFLRGIREVSL